VGAAGGKIIVGEKEGVEKIDITERGVRVGVTVRRGRTPAFFAVPVGVEDFEADEPQAMIPHARSKITTTKPYPRHFISFIAHLLMVLSPGINFHH
jgi:hypothetical protein